MTPQTLAALPIGTKVVLEADSVDFGTIVRAGQTAHIFWDRSDVTSIIDTNSGKWKNFIGLMEEKK